MILIIWVIPNEAYLKKINFVTYDEYCGGLKITYLLDIHP